MIHYYDNYMFYIHINYHESLTNFQKFFCLFVSALALFLVSLTPRIFQAFLFFFPSGAFFYILSIHPTFLLSGSQSPELKNYRIVH